MKSWSGVCINHQNRGGAEGVGGTPNAMGVPCGRRDRCRSAKQGKGWKGKSALNYYFVIQYLVQKITSPIVDHGRNTSTPVAVRRDGSSTEGNITNVS